MVIEGEAYKGGASDGENALIVARERAEDMRSLARSEEGEYFSITIKGVDYVMGI
jgi:hypothetical protein